MNSADTVRAYNKKLENLTTRIENADDNYTSSHQDICNIMTQVNEGIIGNFMSNIPDDESSLPQHVQNERNAIRKYNGKAFLQAIKSQFSRGYNNSPMVECFEDGDGSDYESDISPDEQEDIESNRDDLADVIRDLDTNLTMAETAFKVLRGKITDSQVMIYFTSLAFTNSNLGRMVKEMRKVEEDQRERENDDNDEGFVDGGEALVFNPPSGTPVEDPSISIPKLGDRINLLERDIATIERVQQFFRNTIDYQINTLKNAKKLTSDRNEQERVSAIHTAKAQKRCVKRTLKENKERGEGDLTPEQIATCLKRRG
jgi:hypothetical protein